MFFPQRIESIRSNDKVLEIGPGASPYHRSDEFLELLFDNEKERIAQSGHVGVLNTNKPIHYYDGKKFPFADNSFDYVVCSHVLEHVEDIDFFIKELQRIAPKGYIEFPLIYYDYIYDFDEHLNHLYYDGKNIKWMKKSSTNLKDFRPLTEFFYFTAQKGYWNLVNDLKEYFFQGFEWKDQIRTLKTDKIEGLAHKLNQIELDQFRPNQSQDFRKNHSFKLMAKYYYEKIKKIIK